MSPVRPTSRRASRPSVVLAATGVLAAVALSLAACSSGSGSDGGAQAGAAQGGAAQGEGGQQGEGSAPGQGAGGTGQRPGTSGEIAAISGTTAQVQSSDAQTAVSWSSSTKVTQQVAGKLANVTVGSCVVVTSSSSDGSGSQSSSGSTSSDDPIAAATVVVQAASGSGCTTGAGRAGGTRPSGAPTGGTGEMPQGMPTDRPSGAPTGGTGGRGAGGFGGFATGTVKAVSGSGFTVEQTGFGQDATTTDREVTVGSSTTYTVTKTAKSSAIKVGLCLTAQGQTDSKGTVEATTIALSTKGDDGCSTGFGGMGGFRGGQGGTQGDQSGDQGGTDA
ncbi:hypothetical protein [Luteimicrobium sp. DT211]|uniref:hypothetical protein n=1 Tax=Luteimicrobium sp. DT211 TaxID=3393412 RepID=UPI003CFBA783